MAPSYWRVKTFRNPGMMGLGSVATTPAIVLQVRCTCVRVRRYGRLGCRAFVLGRWGSQVLGREGM